MTSSSRSGTHEAVLPSARDEALYRRWCEVICLLICLYIAVVIGVLAVVLGQRAVLRAKSSHLTALAVFEREAHSPHSGPGSGTGSELDSSATLSSESTARAVLPEVGRPAGTATTVRMGGAVARATPGISGLDQAARTRVGFAEAPEFALRDLKPTLSPVVLAALEKSEQLSKQLETQLAAPRLDPRTALEALMREHAKLAAVREPDIERKVWIPAIADEARRRGKIPSIREDIRAHADFVYAQMSQARGTRVAWYWKRRILEGEDRWEGEFLRRYAATGDEFTSRYLVLRKLPTPRLPAEPSMASDPLLARADPAGP
ncbi:MAG: hypothetical protein KatS3mg110_4303 [Pirellulaceae bacterium]|nr:MAG: hypothetical protein KatS3mg110_4303 [Pirellulaceae bacterium]